MADTKQPHAAAPVESDGIQYSGIVWFLVILIGTVVFCQVFVWGMFEFMESRAIGSDVTRAPLAAAPAEPAIQNGRIVTGPDAPPAGGAVAKPGLLVDEAAVLAPYRKAEDESMASYGWVNQGNGVVRLPIDRAKEIVLERGLPVRQAAAETAAPAEAR